jgi:hypothetical protein
MTATSGGDEATTCLERKKKADDSLHTTHKGGLASSSSHRMMDRVGVATSERWTRTVTFNQQQQWRNDLYTRTEQRQTTRHRRAMHDDITRGRVACEEGEMRNAMIYDYSYEGRGLRLVQTTSRQRRRRKRGSRDTRRRLSQLQQHDYIHDNSAS